MTMTKNWHVDVLSNLFIFCPKYCAKKRLHMCLGTFICICQVGHLADVKELGSDCRQCGACARCGGAGKGRMRAEHAFYRMMGNLLACSRLWAVGGSCALWGRMGIWL